VVRGMRDEAGAPGRAEFVARRQRGACGAQATRAMRDGGRAGHRRVPFGDSRPEFDAAKALAAGGGPGAGWHGSRKTAGRDRRAPCGGSGGRKDATTG